jgi:DNA-binding NarL/FixJ family response regulator
MRVIIADDSVIVREGLQRLLSLEGHEVLAAVTGPDPLMATLAATNVDAVIIDIRMPPTHTDEGLRAAAAIRIRYPGLGIVVLSQYVVPEYAMRLLETGEQYTGYLLKDRVLDPRELTAALDRVVAGGTIIDSDLVSAMLQSKRRTRPLAALTDREREVLKLIAQGLTDKGIADKLFVTTNTVGTHVGHIFSKLGLPEGATENRRVLAVLRYLRDTAHVYRS